jgi:hypothetical protein
MSAAWSSVAARAELSGAVEVGEEMCELRRGDEEANMVVDLDDGGCTEAWELARAVEVRRAAMALVLSSRARGARASKWERERGRQHGLHACTNLRRRVGVRMEHGGHASERVVLDIIPLSIALNGETEKRDEMEPERIFVWWVKYVDTMRPRSV